MLRKTLIAAIISIAMFAGMTTSARAQAQPFLGQIAWVPYNFAPNGWALCDGQIMSIAQNTALFSLLGTTYGGDGVTTFALPNLQDRVMISTGPSDALGQTGGASTVTLTVGQLPAHSHALMASTDEATDTAPTGNVLGSKARVPLYAPAASVSTTMAPASIGTTGSGQPVSTMPPYLTLNCIIALEGIFPSRN